MTGIGKAKQHKAVIFRPITDGNTRVAEMLSGGIDMMVEVPPTSLAKFSSNNFSIAEQAGPHVWFLILNAKEGLLQTSWCVRRRTMPSTKRPLLKTYSKEQQP